MYGPPIMARLLNAARAIFGPPGICKCEGLLTVNNISSIKYANGFLICIEHRSS